MGNANVNGINVYYEIRGSGPRLMVISGTGGDLRRSPNIFDMPLAQHFEVLAYDQRGLGRTSKPDFTYSMSDYAEDAACLEHLKEALVSYRSVIGQPRQQELLEVLHKLFPVEKIQEMTKDFAINLSPEDL